MKARLIQDQSDTPKLLCTDGTILNFIESNDVFLILSNFKYITETYKNYKKGFERVYREKNEQAALPVVLGKAFFVFLG